MTGKDHLVSHGRGGVGNMMSASQDTPLTTADLATPTIKQETFTTGRGGAGNMVHTTDPDVARAAQDVTPVERSHSTRNVAYGRGGANYVHDNQNMDDPVFTSAPSATSPQSPQSPVGAQPPGAGESGAAAPRQRKRDIFKAFLRK